MSQRTFFKQTDILLEICAGIATVGSIVHAGVLYGLSAFFPETYEAWMGNYLLRFLDPLWWWLWCLGMVIFMKYGMFNYSRHVWMIIVGNLIIAGSFPLTVAQGLGYGAILLACGFGLIGINILKNRFSSKNPPA